MHQSKSFGRVCVAAYGIRIRKMPNSCSDTGSASNRRMNQPPRSKLQRINACPAREGLNDTADRRNGFFGNQQAIRSDRYANFRQLEFFIKFFLVFQRKVRVTR
jgi:hypothetical protein